MNCSIFEYSNFLSKLFDLNRLALALASLALSPLSHRPSAQLCLTPAHFYRSSTHCCRSPALCCRLPAPCPLLLNCIHLLHNSTVLLRYAAGFHHTATGLLHNLTSILRFAAGLLHNPAYLLFNLTHFLYNPIDLLDFAACLLLAVEKPPQHRYRPFFRTRQGRNHRDRLKSLQSPIFQRSNVTNTQRLIIARERALWHRSLGHTFIYPWPDCGTNFVNRRFLWSAFVSTTLTPLSMITQSRKTMRTRAVQHGRIRHIWNDPSPIHNTNFAFQGSL